MNLRQKIKKAKRELKALEKKGSGSTMLDMLQHFEQTHALQTLINYKRNYNEQYSWKETPPPIDWKKLTYVGFHSDSKEFGFMVSPNGQALEREKVEAFLNEMIQTKLTLHAKAVSQEEKPAKESFRKHVDYYLTLSNDRTKSKKLHLKKLFYQFKGDDKLYHYASENKGEKEIEKQTEKTPS